MTRDANGLDRRSRRARSSEKVPHDFHRMTHHVVENSAALLRPLPEPRHVWTAVLFSSASEIRSPGERSTSRPDKLLAARDIRSKELILHVTGIQPRTFCETRDHFCLGDISRERLLACETAQLPAAVAN